MRILLEWADNPEINHNLTMKSGMVSTWNKFCFTSGYVESQYNVVFALLRSADQFAQFARSCLVCRRLPVTGQVFGRSVISVAQATARRRMASGPTATTRVTLA